MSDSFRALLVNRDEEPHRVSIDRLKDSDLMEGDVTVEVEFSTVNYKDGLAVTGRAPVIRRFPLIPGIDFAGTVTDSAHSGFKAGDPVLLTGYGVGESHHGGFSERARVDGAWLLPIPPGLDTRRAMLIGTAGFTAMLCVLALERHGLEPGAGDILVTGAAGGVGTVALMLLAKRGYRVVAVTGRPQEKDFLRGLGAADVLNRDAFSGRSRPLAPEQWAGAVDVAGGGTLAHVLSQIRYGGAVAACGLADSMDLPATMAPFILRGVTLCGIDSVQAPMALRREAWQRLARDLDADKLEQLATEISLEEVPDTAGAILEGRVRGRTIVRIK